MIATADLRRRAADRRRACAGSAAFTVARPAGAPVVWVGAYLTGGELVPGQGLQWADAGSFTVAAAPALVAGQSLRVLTRREEGPVEVESRTCGRDRGVPAGGADRRAGANRDAARGRGHGREAGDAGREAAGAARDDRAAVRVLRGAAASASSSGTATGVLFGTGAKRMVGAGMADVRVRVDGGRLRGCCVSARKRTPR